MKENTIIPGRSGINLKTKVITTYWKWCGNINYYLKSWKRNKPYYEIYERVLQDEMLEAIEQQLKNAKKFQQQKQKDEPDCKIISTA